MECVYLGAIRKLKLIGQFHERGKAILEGMSVLQDIWDFYSPGVNVADWVGTTWGSIKGNLFSSSESRPWSGSPLTVRTATFSGRTR